MSRIQPIDEQIAAFKPDGRGGYEEPVAIIDHGDGTESHTWGSTSEAGMRQLRELSRIQRHYQPILDAWQEHFGSYLCEHGIPLDEFSWHINDYCYDNPAEPAADQAATVFTLDGGFHGHDYCMPVWYATRLGCFTWVHLISGYIPQLAPELKT